ncbi:MAG: hypothetical protein ACOCV1_05365 [Bacillota bacterium]
MSYFLLKKIKDEVKKSMKFKTEIQSNIKLHGNNNTIPLSKGNHILSVYRHHNVLLNLKIDNNYIENDIPYDFDGDSVIFELDKNMDSFSSSFPLFIEINKQISNLSVICQEEGQLSLFFSDSKEIEELDYFSLCLIFHENYIKVYKDRFENKIFNPDLRENLSLVNYDKSDKVHVCFNHFDNSIIINNKKYEPKIDFNRKYIILNDYNDNGRFIIKHD